MFDCFNYTHQQRSCYLDQCISLFYCVRIQVFSVQKWPVNVTDMDMLTADLNIYFWPQDFCWFNDHRIFSKTENRYTVRTIQDWNEQESALGTTLDLYCGSQVSLSRTPTTNLPRPLTMLVPSLKICDGLVTCPDLWLELLILRKLQDTFKSPNGNQRTLETKVKSAATVKTDWTIAAVNAL